MVLPDLKTLKFITTGGTTPRSHDERAQETISVKDFNAKGDGSTNDRDAVQSAFDHCFGPDDDPNGMDDAHLNKKLFFPPGKYMIGSPLNLTRVYGGLIYGCGMGTTQLIYNGSLVGGGTLTPLLAINGMARTEIRNLTLSSFVNTDAAAVDLDWDNTAGGDGLHDNVFFCVSFGADYGIVIGKSNHGGSNTRIAACTGGGGATGSVAIDNRGTGAWGTIVDHPSITDSDILYKVHNGSLTVIGGSGEARDWVASVDGADTIFTMLGMRSESPDDFTVADGLVNITGYNSTVGPGSFANVTGGKVNIQACNWNASNGFDFQKSLTGNGGLVYLQGNNTLAGYKDDYTGTVVLDN